MARPWPRHRVDLYAGIEKKKKIGSIKPKLCYFLSRDHPLYSVLRIWMYSTKCAIPECGQQINKLIFDLSAVYLNCHIFQGKLFISTTKKMTSHLEPLLDGNTKQFSSLYNPVHIALYTLYIHSYPLSVIAIESKRINLPPPLHHLALRRTEL